MNRFLKIVTAFLLMSFVTVGCKPDEPIPTDNQDDPVVLDGCVDLGLPSGILWATCNIGASVPEEAGTYFAWGDTVSKEMYDWKSYRYANFVDGNYLLNKYCTNPVYGVGGFADSLTTLEPVDDAATANWGTEWRMPTREEFDELYRETTFVWTTLNGVEGRLLTGRNGNSIFLPATGFYLDDKLICTGLGIYWSSSLQTTSQVSAWSLHFDYENCHVCATYERSRGQCVRAVRTGQ